MAQGYYHANYFHANYWHANYWSAGGSVTGAYWQDFYYHPNYWHANYWAIGAGVGDVSQTSAPTLGFTTFQAQATASLNVQATTPTLALTPQAADATPVLEVQATIPSLSLTPLNTTVDTDTNIYQLGDIDLHFVPDSTFSIEYGVIGSAPSLGFTVMAHSVGAEGGINVATSLPSLGFTTFVTDSRLDIAVEPLPPSLGFTPLSTTAGAGQQIPATQPTLGFTTATHTIVGLSSVAAGIDATTPVLPFTPLNALVETTILPTDSSGNIVYEAKMTIDDDGSCRMSTNTTVSAKMRKR